MKLDQNANCHLVQYDGDRYGSKRMCTLLHRLLHYTTLLTQFPTRNVHSLYINRYQYSQNNTQVYA